MQPPEVMHSTHEAIQHSGFFAEKPWISVLISVGSIGSGLTLQYSDLDVPPILMHYTQMIVWAFAILVSCITTYEWVLRKFFPKKDTDKKDKK